MKDIRKLVAIKTLLTMNPENAIRHDMYRWASNFFKSNLSTTSGTLRNTFEGNASIQFVYDRFVQLERIHQIDQLNVFSNTIPGRI